MLWVNNEDTLVIDNIEVHPNYQKHTEYIREMYNQMIKDMGKTYPNIVQGQTYNDLELYSSDNPFGTLENWHPTAINTPQFYSDARSGCFLLKGDGEILKSKQNTKNKSQEQDEAATPLLFW